MTTFEAVFFTLLLECAGEPIEGQRAVATVIWNEHAAGSKTWKQVCVNPRRYSCWRRTDLDVALETIAPRPEQRETCAMIAQEMIAGTFQPVGPWTHYWNPRTARRQKWMDKVSALTAIGNHVYGNVNRSGGRKD